MVQLLLTTATSLLFNLLVDPFTTYIPAEWFITAFITIAAPSFYLIQAFIYTRRFHRPRHHKYRCHRSRFRRDVLHQNRRRCLTTFHNSRRRYYKPTRWSYPRIKGRILPCGTDSSASSDALSSQDHHDVSPLHSTFQSYVNMQIDSIDVLRQYRAISSILRDSPFRYTQLQKGSLEYTRILLQASSLKAQLFNYDGNPSSPAEAVIYQSSNVTELPIVIDTGASCSITPIIDDFDDTIQKPDITGLNQLSGKTSVIGQGLVTWTIEDMCGVRRKIQTKAYYVPQASIRLFSPQVYIGDHETASLLLDHTGVKFTLKCGTKLTFPLNVHSNLPFMLTTTALDAQRRQGRIRSHFVSFELRDAYSQQASLLTPELQDSTSRSIFNSLTTRSVIRRDNYNLHPFQQELLLWHCKLGHADFQRVQSLLSKPGQPRGSIGRGEINTSTCIPALPGSSSCKPPRCEACQYAKQKRTTPHNPKHPSSDYEEGSLSRNQLHPGDRLSCDQYMSTTQGRLAHTQGKEAKSFKLVGGTMFIDHATNYIFHQHQINLTAAASVNSKHALEAHLAMHGVQAKHYVSDNHPFTSKIWVDDCNAQHQQRSLSGVGAHHQNYMERHIQIIFNWSRASMLHFVLHWPQLADEDLWPFAVDYSVYLWNNLPARHISISPKEILTDSLFANHNHLQRSHVFGCPVFVLDPRLQDGKSIPKWSMRSRRGIYLGVSPYHNSTVHLILNPATGSISPQYHVVFDDTFSTVFSNGQFDESKWIDLLSTGYDRNSILIPDTNGDIHVPPDSTPFEATSSTTDEPSQPLKFVTDSPAAPTTSASEGAAPILESSPEGATAPSPTHNIPTQPLSLPEGAEPAPAPIQMEPSPPPAPRRSTRTRQAPRRLLDSMLGSYYNENDVLPTHIPGSKQVSFKSHTSDRLSRVTGESLEIARLASIKWSILLEACSSKLATISSYMAEHQHSLIDTIDGCHLVNYLHPALLSILPIESDTPSFTEAMNGPNAAGFFKAMEIEIQTLLDMETFDIIDKLPWMKVVSSTWAFKVKRYPDGSIRKLKARLCARGYEQVEGIDYFETFAPVVQWVTIRLILVMTVLLGLENQQIDYTAAFVQAPIDTDVYIQMPKLFASEGKVWKLKKSIYGLKQSPRNYFLHLKGKLEKLGFTQSTADPCLFISPTVICLVYVDDALLVYRDTKAVTDLTRRMKEEDMLFNVESDVAGYLGVLIERKDGVIVMRQEGLAKKIVTALRLDDNSITSLRTPANAYLPIDVEGERAIGLYNYASVVGMLNYLQGHSRIDICFAVSQVARYVHAPRRSHELALERIGRYLKGTLDKGLILHPIKNIDQFKIDVYVDAAFACGWGTEEGTNPESVKSRTGFLVEVMGCTVIWCSKMQSMIATSTMESEYIALSMSLRAAIPLLAICTAINRGLHIGTDKLLTFKATIHEDNLGALTLANLEPGRHTPRSKFYALRLHWFRSWLKPQQIELIHCPTKLQKADYLTKPLGATDYEVQRQLSMGW